jgi:hypothetical protein
MPDDDRFPRYLSPAWRKVLHCLQGNDPAERVGDAVTKALAATIRTIHGIPSLPSLAEKMCEAASNGDPLRFDSPAGRKHVPTKIAERAAATLAMTMQRELVLVSCLLRRQALIAGGRSDADELTRYRRRSPAGTDSLVAMTWQLERLRDCLNTTDPWQGIVSEFPPIMDVERLAPAQVTRLYGAYVQEWEAVDLASFGLRGDRSAALCETKSDQS